METIEISDRENTIEIEDEYHDITFEFFPDVKEFGSKMYLKEDAYSRTEKNKYKISLNPIEVSLKLIERYDEPPIKYEVKDGVVLKSDIIQKTKDSLGKNYSEEGTLQYIENLEKELEWRKILLSSGSPLLFYILSRHPEIIPSDEYRKFLRQTDERIKNGLLKIERFLKEKDSSGLQIFEADHGKYIWYPGNERFSKEKQKEAVDYVRSKIHEPLFNPASDQYSGISEDEFSESSKILKSTDLFLSRKDEVSPIKKDQSVNQPPTSKKTGAAMKWVIVIVLSVIALSWGVWTAIGVFILGAIIISVLSR
jgi:hypothetical protein